MKIRTLGRHFRTGGQNVIRNGWMTFASTSAIAISLFVLGVFLLLAMNVDHLAKQIERQVEILVYLDLNIPSYERVQVQEAINKMSGVKKVTYISKDEGLEILSQKFGEDGEKLLESFKGENNPLNESLTVEVKDPTTVGKIAAKIEKLNEGRTVPPIFKVNYGQGTVEKLFQVTKLMRNIGFVIAVGLLIAGFFLIANTIKITILARRKEIEIMKLVGATNGFIRWPFFVEGLILGLVGSFIPSLLLLIGYNQLLKNSAEEISLLIGRLLPINPYLFQIIGILMMIGVFVGIWGSTVSIRKHLRV
jgi:cell division transport system permease protein